MLKTYLPSDLICEKTSETSDGNGASESSGALTIGRATEIGLNVTEGIMYSGGEEEFYLEIVTDYANSVEEKCESLQSFKDKKDWENYRILVHSIKSTSKTIGADEVSAKAKQLEDASKTEDVGYIEENHDSFIKEYKDLSNRILGR